MVCQLKTMPPKLRSKDGRHPVIRPLSNVAPSLLPGQELFDFTSLRTTAAGQGDEDAWLDQEP